MTHGRWFRGRVGRTAVGARPTAAFAATLAGVLALAGGCTGAGDPSSRAGRDFQPGADGVGDPYFPTYGNGGYDVANYDLKVRYDPATDRLDRHRHHHRHRHRRTCPGSTSTWSG